MKAKSTIERLKTQITKLTEASVKGVIDLRLSRGSFYDDSYKSNRKTFMQTCEGLEIILIPVVTIRSQILLQAINKNEVKKSIENDINYLINSVNKQSYQFFSGSPYYEIGKKPKIAKNSIDALGFYTNVLVHLYELINKQVIKSTTLTKGYVEGHLLKCVEALINCCGTMGWSFYIDNQTIPDEYPTWSILETVADIQTYFPLGYKKIEESGILKKVEDWLIGRTKNGAIKELHEFISSFPPDIDIHNPTVSSRAKCFYDVCHLLSGLAILDSAGDIKLGHNINYLLTRVDIILEKEFVIYYPNGNEAQDYTLAPMLLKCLSYIFQTHYQISGKDNKVEQGMGLMASIKDEALFSVYDFIVKNKRHYNKKNGTFTGFFSDAKTGQWGPEELMVDIYYTERVIEALIAFYDYLSDNGVKINLKKINIESLSSKQTLIKVLNKSISTRTGKSKFANLPSLNLYHTKLHNDYGNVFENKIILCVQHFLSDLPPFVDYLVGLGADYKNIYLLQKTYDYPERKVVHDYFKEMGCHIEMLSSVEADKQIALKNKFLKKILDKCGKNRELLIIEDGGHFVPILHQQEYENYIKFCLGAVEQTTRGIKNINQIQKISIPIVNVAKSVLKNEMESPEVAQTIAQNIKYVTDHNEIHWHTTKVNVLIIGSGAIGNNAAERLKNIGFKVSVYDKNEQKRNELSVKWKKSNIEVINELKDLSKFDVLLGLTGEETINRDVILACKHNAILASGSSETYEIDLKIIEESTKLPLKRNIKKYSGLPITEYNLINRKSIRVLCNGEPLNFALSSGIPKVSIEPILMQLFWGAVNIARNDSIKPGIIDFPSAIEDEIKKEFDFTQPS